MSITFSIQGIEEEHGYELPCPDCGLSMRDVSAGKSSPPDCSCMGYGGPDQLPVPRYELNISNFNAAALFSHLRIEFDDCGTIDPREILTALAVYPAQALISSDESSSNLIMCGRSADTVKHYYDRLTRISQMALEYGRNVVWC